MVGAASIILNLILMNRAIDLHDQALLRTTEIGDEKAERMLAAESRIGDLPPADSVPEDRLCRRRIVAV
jgi:hypothetical protein